MINAKSLVFALPKSAVYFGAMRTPNVMAGGCAVVALCLVACAGTDQRPTAGQPLHGASDAEQIEAIVRAGQEIEKARSAPFDQTEFNKQLAAARRPFDSCVEDQIDRKLSSLSASPATPDQRANLLVGECRPALQPVYNLIYMSPLSNRPAEAREVTDRVWSEARQRIIDAI